MSSTRNINLDLIKTLAMLMVLGLHISSFRYAIFPSTALLPEVYPICGIAIPLFFMTSGYLMSHKTPDKSYIYRKIYGIVRFCFIICTLFTCYNLATTRSLSGSIYFPLCFLQHASYGLGVFWYFGAMMMIYWLLPYLVKVMRSTLLPRVLLVLFSIEVLVFVLNITIDFEYHIIQTFRIWNWLFYFLLGAYVRLHPSHFERVRWYYPFIAMLLFAVELRLLPLNGNEYHFVSPLCMLYALTAFVALLKVKCANSKLIPLLSSTFLFVYAFHVALFDFLFRGYYLQLDPLYPPVISFSIEYILGGLLIISMGVLVMKIPFMNRVFRI